MMKATMTAAALVGLANGVFAAGSDFSAPPKPTKTTTECIRGQVFDEKKGACGDPKESSLTDDQLYGAARELAYAGQYDTALTVLALAKDQNDPRILNYKGFANRKAGRMEVGMAYYRAALDRDPNHILARSYMGQALVQQGDMLGAKAQLAEIRTRGGRNSWAYTALKLAISGQPSNY